MASKTEIANLALSHLGTGNEINNLGQSLFGDDVDDLNGW